MKNYLTNAILYTVVLLNLYVVVSSSLADTKQSATNIVVIKQEQLDARRPAEPLSKRIGAESLEGGDIDLVCLPAAASTNLERMAACVMSRMEFSAIDPKEAIRFVVRKPKSKNMICLGVVSDDQNSVPDPVWFDDLQRGSNKLSCSWTNASLLDLSLLLAEVIDCEFGVTPDGEVLFRNRTQQAKAKYPVYIVKRKPKESQ